MNWKENEVVKLTECKQCERNIFKNLIERKKEEMKRKERKKEYMNQKKEGKGCKEEWKRIWNIEEEQDL